MIRERSLLGSPGIYRDPDTPVRALTGVRMDVAAFVGVAPRGPARLPAYDAWWATPPLGATARGAPRRSLPVPVESWSAYRRLFGGFEGPGLLPYAVAAFFEQGGRRCYVVRVVHDYGAGDPRNEEGIAFGEVPGVTGHAGGPVKLRARSEGQWGNSLRASLSFTTRPLLLESISPSGVTAGREVELTAGTLLRLWLPGGTSVLRYVTDVREVWGPDRPRKELHGSFEAATGVTAERAEIVEAELVVEDRARDRLARGELHERLGLSPLHPRWLAAVLYRDSLLVYPAADWIHQDLVVTDPGLRAPALPDRPQFRGGMDRYEDIDPEDFFDPRWEPEGEIPGSGVHALVEIEEISSVVAPDLYSPRPLLVRERVSGPPPAAGAEFEICLDVGIPPAAEAAPAGELEGLRLDPGLPGDLAEIVRLQGRLVELAERVGTWVVLLDVPPGLSQRATLAWRNRFGSSHAAAYLPWIVTARPDDSREALIQVNPSAFAAGIVARQENVSGVPHGPANVVALGALAVAERLSASRHDELHRGGLNVYLLERDGVRLTAARTLSRDPAYRQLSVRRLMTLLRRTLLIELQWSAFEPHHPALREELRWMLDTFLRDLFLAGAFRGRLPEEAYFVRCDDELNPPQVVDAGRLVCEIGVAPAEPLEFIVLRLSREGDGTLLLEE